MGAPSAASIRRVPGRLAFGCTDITLAYPHGGTALGEVRDVIFRRFTRDFPVTAEDKGGQPVGYLATGNVWGCVAFMRGFDDDVIELLRGGSEGTTTQRAQYDANTTYRAGYDLTADAVKLVFTPEGAAHAKSASVPDADAPCWVLWNAVPLLDETADFLLQRDEELGVPLLFMGTEDGSGRTLSVRRRADLTL